MNLLRFTLKVSKKALLLPQPCVAAVKRLLTRTVHRIVSFATKCESLLTRTRDLAEVIALQRQNRVWKLKTQVNGNGVIEIELYFTWTTIVGS